MYQIPLHNRKLVPRIFCNLPCSVLGEQERRVVGSNFEAPSKIGAPLHARQISFYCTTMVVWPNDPRNFDLSRLSAISQRTFKNLCLPKIMIASPHFVQTYTPDKTMPLACRPDDQWLLRSYTQRIRWTNCERSNKSPSRFPLENSTREDKCKCWNTMFTIEVQMDYQTTSWIPFL